MRSLSTSSFITENANLKQLMDFVKFSIYHYNDSQQLYSHYTHKNLPWKQAPFNTQHFQVVLNELTNVKYIQFQNFTHGSEVTISVAEFPNTQFTEVYKEKFVCQGKALKQFQKNIDIGALPCRAIRVSVFKGAKFCSKKFNIIGIESEKIKQKLGEQYYKLLVVNPAKILYKE